MTQIPVTSAALKFFKTCVAMKFVDDDDDDDEFLTGGFHCCVCTDGQNYLIH